MLLYHAGFDVIKEPDIYYGRKNADFGQGFYMTPDKEFAYRWAKKRSGQSTIVNCYNLDLTNLKVQHFNRDASWYEYIYDNRHGKADSLDADVVIGPIANDIIYDTLGITTSGFLNKEESMKLLMIGPEYLQVVIKSAAAKSNLRWLSNDTLSSEQLKSYQELMAKEEYAFQELFAKTLEEI